MQAVMIEVEKSQAQHEALIHSFHGSLMQDPMFMELLSGKKDGQETPKGAEPSSSPSSLEFLRSCMQPSASDSDVDLDDVGATELIKALVNVAGIEELFNSIDASQLVPGVERMQPLLQACVQGMRSQDQVVLAHSLELLCLVLRGAFQKGQSSAEVLGAFGGAARAENFFRRVVGFCCEILVSEASSSFVCILSIKLLNVLATANRGPLAENSLLRWLWVESAAFVVLSLGGRSEVLNHCLSLDSSVLLVVMTQYLTCAEGAAKLGSTKDLDRPHRMRCALEIAQVLAIVTMRLFPPPVPAAARRPSFLANLMKQGNQEAPSSYAQVQGDKEGGVLGMPGTCFLNAFLLLWYECCTNHHDSLLACREFTDGAEQGAEEELGGDKASAGRLLALSGGALGLCNRMLAHEDIGMQPQIQLLLSSLVALSENSEVLKAMTQGALVVQSQVAGGAGKVQEQAAAGPSPLNLVCDSIISFMSNNIKLAIEVGHYSACLRIMHRVLCFDKNRDVQGGAGVHVDGGALSAVCLRLLSYLSRDAVFSAGGAAVANLVAQTAAMLNFLLSHADQKMLPLPSTAKGLEGVLQASRDGLGRTHLCSEIARVGANKTFVKLLTHCAATENGADGAERGPGEASSEMQGGVRQLQAVSDHVNDAVLSWQEDNKQISPTPPQVMSVVAAAVDAMQLPTRDELLQPERFPGTECAKELTRSMCENLVYEYRACVHVMPAHSNGPQPPKVVAPVPPSFNNSTGI